jgi:hypothetical protein
MDKQTKRIWEGLAAYANSETLDVEALQQTLVGCMDRLARGQIWGWQPLFLETEGPKYQRDVKQLLLFLCGDQEQKAQARSDVCEFLHQHGVHIKFSMGDDVSSADIEFVTEQWGLTSPEDFRINESDRPRRTEDEGALPRILVKDYEDMADPICDFVCRENLKFQREEYKRPTPVFVCQECGKFFVPQRIKNNQRCSQDCRDRHSTARTSDASADYQWLRRLRKDVESKGKGKGSKVAVGAATRTRFEQIKNGNCRPMIQKLVGEIAPRIA